MKRVVNFFFKKKKD